MNDNQPLTDLPPISTAQVAEFIQRWQNAGGSERANYQLFLTELCSLLRLLLSDSATDDNCHNDYVLLAQ